MYLVWRPLSTFWKNIFKTRWLIWVKVFGVGSLGHIYKMSRINVVKGTISKKTARAMSTLMSHVSHIS